MHTHALTSLSLSHTPMYLDLHLILSDFLVSFLFQGDQFGLSIIPGIVGMSGALYNLTYGPLTTQQLLCVCVGVSVCECVWV